MPGFCPGLFLNRDFRQGKKINRQGRQEKTFNHGEHGEKIINRFHVLSENEHEYCGVLPHHSFLKQA